MPQRKFTIRLADLSADQQAEIKAALIDGTLNQTQVAEMYNLNPNRLSAEITAFLDLKGVQAPNQRRIAHYRAATPDETRAALEWLETFGTRPQSSRKHVGVKHHAPPVEAAPAVEVAEGLSITMRSAEHPLGVQVHPPEPAPPLTIADPDPDAILFQFGALDVQTQESGVDDPALWNEVAGIIEQLTNALNAERRNREQYQAHAEKAELRIAELERAVVELTARIDRIKSAQRAKQNVREMIGRGRVEIAASAIANDLAHELSAATGRQVSVAGVERIGEGAVMGFRVEGQSP